MPIENKAPHTMPPSMVSEIAATLTHFLGECGMTYPRDVCLDESFRVACYVDATRRGLDLSVMGKSLDAGIAIAYAAYQHIKNDATRIFIAVWTGVLTYVDDAYEALAKGLEEFFDRFHEQQPQRFEVLDQVASMIHEIPSHWGAIASNHITIAELDFITSLIMDNEMKGMEILPSMAPGYPYFMRQINGISRAYCVMAFPPELDLKTWIQIIPGLMHYISHVNDLLSFFKEELEGENLNFVSMSAKSNGITKIEALRNLTGGVTQSYNRGSQLLQSAPAALEAYRAFCVGYVEFHVLPIRYKLDRCESQSHICLPPSGRNLLNINTLTPRRNPHEHIDERRV